MMHMSKTEIAEQNLAVIREFFSLYLKDKSRFYELWVVNEPKIITPFVTGDVAVCRTATHSGWPAIKAFYDPIFDQMHGRFDWFIDEIIEGANPDIIVVKTHSDVNVEAGPIWGNKQLEYSGRYIQIFKFRSGKIESFEEYYDTAFLNSIYG